MNQIRIKRLLLGGLATFLMLIAAEILLEHVLARALFGDVLQELWAEALDLSDWSVSNHATNLLVGLLNSTLLIWLYASLRPMYGVGTKTALITAALVAIWAWSMAINAINLGLVPCRVTVLEMVFETLELPIVILVGAGVYEGLREGEDGTPRAA